MLPWATSFVRLLKPKPKQKMLVPNAMITYRRAQTLGNALTNYKSVALGEEKNWKTSGKCAGCGKCGLCGNWGALKNMVNNTDCINIKGGKTIKIKQVLTCRDYGIYAAQCVLCKETYIGQTCTSFRTRWNTHRNDWREMMKKKGTYDYPVNKDAEQENNDDKALFLHFETNHKQSINNMLNLWDAYSVTFVERPRKNNLDAAENSWIEKTNAKINKARTHLPKFK